MAVISYIRRRRHPTRVDFFCVNDGKTEPSAAWEQEAPGAASGLGAPCSPGRPPSDGAGRCRVVRRRGVMMTCPPPSASPGRLLSPFAHVCAEGTRDMHAQRVPGATGPRSFVSSRPETAPCASPSCSTPRRRLAGVPPPTPSDGRVPLFRSWACGNYSPRAITPLAAHLPRSWPPSSAPVLP